MSQHNITPFDCAKLLSTGFFGHFAAKLADAWFLADSTNQWKIERHWDDLFMRASERIEAEAKRGS